MHDFYFNFNVSQCKIDQLDRDIIDEEIEDEQISEIENEYKIAEQ